MKLTKYIKTEETYTIELTKEEIAVLGIIIGRTSTTDFVTFYESHNDMHDGKGLTQHCDLEESRKKHFWYGLYSRIYNELIVR